MTSLQFGTVSVTASLELTMVNYSKTATQAPLNAVLTAKILSQRQVMIQEAKHKWSLLSLKQEATITCVCALTSQPLELLALTPSK
jgi:hypothetical protein